MLSVIMLSVIMLSVVMLNVAMLSVIMLNIIMLSVVMLNEEVSNQTRVKPLVILHSKGFSIPCPGKSYRGGRLNTVDLLVLTSLDQLGFILKILFSFFTKQATWRSTVLSLPPQLVFPALPNIVRLR
jgi:hypothetical protein